MTAGYGKGMDPEEGLTVNKGDFELGSLEDELRVDELCRKLLQRFYLQLMEEGMTPAEATTLADSADYFVRDFVVAVKQRNIFAERAGIVRQFAGNWYIISNMEPDIRQLSAHLDGIKAFYRFLHGHKLLSDPFMMQVEGECGDIAYYESRIGSFLEITGDGYGVWERECTLKGN
ncbi:MAG: hypothetical protein FD174_686 [Geobacteraceae bacterium]|nr:MAG: hypothetical protein FD174_686 [Geobacteraceae bacterium]